MLYFKKGSDKMNIKPIAKIHNDFPTKFGLPRQSGMSEHLISRVVMEKEFSNPDAFRGIEEFEYLWLIWGFEPVGTREWSPTVRPPKLGGNTRRGVFATRSPNRPNPLGLTRVKLVSVEKNAKDGVVLAVSGADLMDGTEIFDIKPYLSFADSVPNAKSGRYGAQYTEQLEVIIPEAVQRLFGEEQLEALREVLALDPRPGYQHDSSRVYGFAYGKYDVRFRVEGGTLTVVEATNLY